MNTSGKMTRWALFFAASSIKETHFWVVSLADKKIGATWQAAARRMGAII
jgi:hypothetical protein